MKTVKSIDEGQQNFIKSLLISTHSLSYNDLTEDMKSVIDERGFNELIKKVNGTEHECKLTDLLIVVDYINSYVSGNLGSAEALSIEDNLCTAVKAAIESESTAVVFLIDFHSGNSYYNSFEFKNAELPIHASTPEERKLHGKLDELVTSYAYYDENTGTYVNNEEYNIYFVEKYSYGASSSDVTNDIDGELNNYVDKMLNSYNESRYISPSLIRKLHGSDDYDWDMIYDSIQNISQLEFIPDNIVIVGSGTNLGVLNTAVLLHNGYPQANIYVPENLTASYNKNLHDHAIAVLKSMGVCTKKYTD